MRMDKNIDRNNQIKGQSKKGQEGYGVIIVIMLMFFFFVLIVSGVSSAMRADRSVENLATKQKEKWEAKSALSTLKRIVEVRLPERYNSDIEAARACLSQNSGISSLSAFDEQDLPAEQSVPVLRTLENGESFCNSQPSMNESGFTSLLGNTNTWAGNRVSLWLAEAQSFGFNSSQIGVARIAEIVRRFNNVGEPVYQFGFILDTRGGQHYRLRDQGEVEVGAVTQNCGATGRLEINPRIVQQGNPVIFRITYTNVNRLRIFDQSNAVIHEAFVTVSSDPQIYEWNYTPAATGSYRVEALSNDSGCFSRSEWIQVEVTVVPPTCPVIDSLTANPNAVQSGENSTIAWSVRNASDVTLESEVVGAAGTKDFTILATRTFTLVARDAGNVCPATRQVTVTVLPPPCLTPTVAVFQINPTTATPGAAVTLTWQVNNVMPGGVVNITLPDGTILSNVGASGSQNITAPMATGNYNYTINVSNPCGTTASATTQLQVANSCEAPTINSFLANPSMVTQGGNQTVVLSWNVTGTIDSQSIDGIGSVSGTSYSLPQPNTTTDYTYRVVGCGVERTAQTRVTVTSNPSTFSCPMWQEDQPICSVVIGGNCTTARVSGNVASDGTVATGNFTVEPGYFFGQEYLISHTFVITDSENRQLATGAINYDNTGNAYLAGSSPAGSVVSYSQNSLSWRANVLPGASNPNIKVQVTLSYGAAAGFENLSFNSAASCGGSAGGCSRNTRYPLQVYSAPSNQYVDIDLLATVSPTGVLNGTFSLNQVVSESVNQGLYVQIRDSLDRQVFAQNVSGTTSSYVEFNNITPLVPSPPNNTYRLFFQWSGMTTSNESQNAGDVIEITESGCP